MLYSKKETPKKGLAKQASSKKQEVSYAVVFEEKDNVDVNLE